MLLRWEKGALIYYELAKPLAERDPIDYEESILSWRA